MDILLNEEATFLPEREALSLFNFAAIRATNIAVSSQTLTNRSLSSANAGQSIVVVQR